MSFHASFADSRGNGWLSKNSQANGRYHLMIRTIANPNRNEFYRAIWVFTYFFLTVLLLVPWFQEDFGQVSNLYAVWPSNLFWRITFLILSYWAFFAGMWFNWGPTIPLGFVALILFPSTIPTGIDTEITLMFLISFVPGLLVGFILGAVLEMGINFFLRGVVDQSGLVAVNLKNEQQIGGHPD